jgi:hypothetical protein
MKLTPPVWILFGGGWLIQAAHRSLFRQAYVDSDVHLALARQVLDRGAARLAVIEGTDPTVVNLVPMPDLMPGLTWLLAGWWKILGDPYLALLVSDLTALGALFFLIYKTYRHFSPQTTPWALAFFLATSLTPWRFLSSSDILALALYGWAVWFSFRWHGSQRTSHLLFALACSFLAFFVRYAYLPMMGALPLALGFAMSWQPLKNRVLPLGLWLAGALLLGGGWFFWEKISGSGTYLYGGEAAWYPQNLLALDPFPVKSLLYLNWSHVSAAAGYLGVPFSALNAILWLISIAGVAFAGWVAFTHRKSDGRLWLGARFWAGLAVVNTAMLMYLSLRNQSQSWNEGGFWTFVMETRYFAPVLLVGQGLLWSLTTIRRWKWLRWIWVAVAVMPFALQLLRLTRLPHQSGDWRVHEGRQVVEAAAHLKNGSGLPAVFADTGGGWGPAIAGLPRVEADSISSLTGGFNVLIIRYPDEQMAFPPHLSKVSADTLVSGRVLETWATPGL